MPIALLLTCDMVSEVSLAAPDVPYLEHELVETFREAGERLESGAGSGDHCEGCRWACHVPAG